MPFELINPATGQRFELDDGATLVVGRAAGCDLPVIDPTVSRRHAELVCDVEGVRVRDLGSSNGTLVNGARVQEARLADGDVVTFGSVSFRLAPISAAARAPALGDQSRSSTLAGDSTILRERPLDQPTGLLSTIARASNLAEARAHARLVEGHERAERKLALLLEVSKALSRAVDVDALLETVTGMLFQILDVDRVSIELLNQHGERAPAISRDRHGTLPGGVVPSSIARRVVEEKVAILSANAPEDARFGGPSIIANRVCSAMCAPLIGSADRVHGLLYVDNLTATDRLDDDDLDFLVAFTNIAAAAIENGRLAERVRHEALVRSNFERFFAPALAARIAESPEAVRLGGEKCRVAVLFSDIRGFTRLSETMRPDDVAALLSEYFTAMAEIVFRHGGTLDKFIGDALLAQWGAPVPAPDGAERAVRAAIDMAGALEALNERWHTEGRPHLEIGIGLNYGESFAGYIGSERRLEYTVIGDVVNVASRLCSAATGGEILLTEEMRAALTSSPPLIERETTALRGKSQPVPIYSVVR